MLFRITPQDQMIVNINIQLILHRMSFIGFRNNKVLHYHIKTPNYIKATILIFMK